MINRQTPAPADEAACLHRFEKEGASRDAILDCFDRLEPLDVGALRGRWRGTGLRSGHPLDGMLEAFGWYGKAFHDTETAFPLLFGSAVGTTVALQPRWLPLRLAARLQVQRWAPLRIVFPAVMPLLATRAPSARLRMVEHRGMSSAAMVYDALPIIDVFRRIDDATILGLMDCRYFSEPFFFSLRRE